MSLDIVSLRSAVDDLDTRIARLIRERIATARVIVESKRAQGLPITDLDRENLIVDRIFDLISLAERDSVARIYAEIFREAKK
jgi:chorismate mutase